MSADDLIVVEQVAKNFGTFPALSQVDLRVRRGQCLLLAGANGAGKSTLLRLLAGLGRPSRGRVLVNGSEPHRSAEARRALGLVSHHPLLYEDLTASENLLFYCRLYGLSQPEARVRQALSEAGLESRRDHRVRTYSRGMKQRLALARAALHAPEVLLFDEPYTGLDQRAAEALSRHLGRLKADGCTTVLVTHRMDEAVAMMDQLVILRRGRVCCHAEWTGGDLAALERLYASHLEEGR
jgi:heme ABC exporter ATP-binding subunit CcmA